MSWSVVMSVAPRGLSCSSSISAAAAAAVEKRNITMSRLWGGKMRVLLHGSPVPLSSRALAHPSLPLRRTKLSSVSIPFRERWGNRARSYSGDAALEEPAESTKKSLRLSREERAALVDNFVRKYMAANQGEFPTLAAVLKETGGSRPVVKDILAEIQVSLKGPESVAAEERQVKVMAIDKVEVSVTEEAVATSTDNSLKAAASVFPVEDGAKQQDQESKSTEKVTTMRRMVGETPGEINTYNDILDRLRSLGAASPRSKAPDSGEKVVAEAPSTLSGTSSNEHGEKDIQRKPSFAARIQPPRHGMFVRFLHPSATEEDLREAYADCGEIARVSAVKPMKATAKFTYGFIDFKTAEGLSSALKKSVEIRGNKVATEPAPVQNTGNAAQENIPWKTKESQASGTALIDNLVSKVVSMVPPNSENGNLLRNQMNSSPASDVRKSQTPPINSNARVGGSSSNSPDQNRGFVSSDPYKLRNIPNGREQWNPNGNIPQPPQSKMPPSTVASAASVQNDLLKLRRNFSVSLDNLPANVNVSHLKESLSIYGEVGAIYLKRREANMSSFYFEFTSEEAKERALCGHWVFIDGQQFRITRADTPKTTVARITNISPNTPDNEFVNVCKSFGQVERVEQRRERVRDVFFHQSEIKNMPRILDRLNEMNMNSYKWQARPAPRCPPSVVSAACGTVEGQEWICSQIKQLVKNQESLLQQMQIEHRDLKELTSYVVDALSSRKV